MTNSTGISFPILTSEPKEEGALKPQLDKLAEVIEQRTMMQFGAERRTHFVNTITMRAQTIGAELNNYLNRLSTPAGENEMALLIDALTINETTFFRNVPQLDLFARMALPEVIAQRQASGGSKQIEVWSAACSTGQEVYTLAMLADEFLMTRGGWQVQVRGTDISPTVIETARRGIYPKARLDTIPPHYLTRYFEDRGDRLVIRDALRRLTSFQVHNLKEMFPPCQFDIIFCRNVMIYFSRDEQACLARKFYERLTPGGFLFIGHSESLQGLGSNFKLRIQDRGVAYQKE